MRRYVRRLAILGFVVIAAWAGGAVQPAAAQADAYPNRPVKLVVGFAAGGPSDLLARIIGQWLTERLGQQFVIENRPGAGSNIATEAVVNASPDGYTILIVATGNAINTSFYDKLPFDFVRDIAPVAGLARVPSVMAINPSLPAKTVAEFITYGKANPGKINAASGGTGTAVHLAAELFKTMTGVNLVHVPYRGLAPAMTDLISGQVQLMFGDMPSAIQHIRSGSIRGLAVTTAARSAIMPDLPTVAETVPGYEASAWFGLGAPKGTPPAIVAKLNREVNAGLSDAKLSERIEKLGAAPIVVTPLEFETFIAAETRKWAAAVKASGAKAE
ncbi:MAG: tripartite tricarboxylate transporter substrate binding protein [Hyphomicrobiales bacterium]